MNKILLLLTFTILISLNQTNFCKAQQTNSSANPCDTSGRCGPFGSCNAQDSPICSCLRGFDPVDTQQWTSDNWTSGCQRRVPLACTNNGSRPDGFLSLDQVKISGYTSRFSGPESVCGNRCLMNCSCMAYGYDSGIGCMFWGGAFMDLQRFPSGSNILLHVRVAGSELDSSKKDNKKTIIIIVVVIAVVTACICGFLYWKCFIRRKGQLNATTRKDENATASGAVDALVQEALSRVNLVEFPLFKIEVLVVATDNFSDDNKLGMGGFGPVFKGVLPNGREIAVKRLSKASGQGLQEFMNEVELISKLQHRNLVRLLGCCVENNEKMLIYEYMPNKSLDVLLFDPSQDILDWRKRFNIIEGICRGLLYLHRDSRLKIIHRDLKPSNVLLDNDWNPKISDFGMARIYGTTQDHVSTVRVVGTYGYMAPEYAIGGRFSDKSDVFSFGVLMLELTAGRKNASFVRAEGSSNLLGHAWELWNEDNLATLIDSRILNPSNQVEILRCMHIGLLCAQELPQDRPSISTVLSMLSSNNVALPVPKEPAFSVKSSRSHTGASSSQQNSSSSASVNNITLTVVEGR